MRTLLIALLLFAQVVWAGPALYPNSSLSYGLVGWWTLNESSGTVACDSSGFTGNGTLIASPVWTNGVVGSGLYLQRYRGVNIPYTSILAPGTGSVSYVFWILHATQAAGGFQFVICNNGLQIYSLSSGLLKFDFYDGTHESIAQSGKVIDDGLWHHIACVRDKTSNHITIYVDGLSGTPVTDTSVDLNSTGQNLEIGYFHLSSGNYYVGSIDDVRIYNRPLSADEVKALYNGGYGQ